MIEHCPECEQTQLLLRELYQSLSRFAATLDSSQAHVRDFIADQKRKIFEALAPCQGPR